MALPRELRPTALDFNRELVAGELGALLLANLAAPVVSHCTRNAAVISGTAVAATLAGGSLSWLAARLYDRRSDRTYGARSLARDLGYFTPAALGFGFCVYDPAIYLISHYCLTRGAGVWRSVMTGQVAAFFLFLVALNAYRLLVLRLRGRAL